MCNRSCKMRGSSCGGIRIVHNYANKFYVLQPKLDTKDLSSWFGKQYFGTMPVITDKSKAIPEATIKICRLGPWKLEKRTWTGVGPPKLIVDCEIKYVNLLNVTHSRYYLFSWNHYHKSMHWLNDQLSRTLFQREWLWNSMSTFYLILTAHVMAFGPLNMCKPVELVLGWMDTMPQKTYIFENVLGKKRWPPWKREVPRHLTKHAPWSFKWYVVSFKLINAS